MLTFLENNRFPRMKNAVRICTLRAVRSWANHGSVTIAPSFFYQIIISPYYRKALFFSCMRVKGEYHVGNIHPSYVTVTCDRETSFLSDQRFTVLVILFLHSLSLNYFKEKFSRLLKWYTTKSFKFFVFIKTEKFIAYRLINELKFS